MKKRTKIITAAAASVFAAAAAVGILLYFQVFRKAEQTIETLRKLTENQAYSLTADCKVSLEPSEENEVLALLAQQLFGSRELSLKVGADGKSCGRDLNLDISAGTDEKMVQLTTLCLTGGTCYLGVDRLAAAVAGDALENNPVMQLAYQGWIRDHYVTWDQLETLLFELTGMNWEPERVSLTWGDVLLFFLNPEHLFDPDMWSAVQVTEAQEGYSSYRINADYFAELVGIEKERISAVLSFRTDEKKENFDLRLELSFTDDNANKITASADVSADRAEEAEEIQAPKLLLTDEQTEKLKELIELLLEGK